MTAPRSLAVGLVRHPAAATDADRRLARVKLALAAYDKGYALVDVFEDSGGPGPVETPCEALERVAVEIGADAVFIAGPVDRARVEDVAARVRLLVCDVGSWG